MRQRLDMFSSQLQSPHCGCLPEPPHDNPAPPHHPRRTNNSPSPGGEGRGEGERSSHLFPSYFDHARHADGREKLDRRSTSPLPSPPRRGSTMRQRLDMFSSQLQSPLSGCAPEPPHDNPAPPHHPKRTNTSPSPGGEGRGEGERASHLFPSYSGHARHADGREKLD
jgi:hypothetical protein